MQKFNANNVEARFIKNILKNIYLPSIPTVTDGDYVVEGAEYCYRNNIIRCTLSGTLAINSHILNNITYVDRNDFKHKSPAASDACICTSDFLCGLGIRNAEYKIIGDISYTTYAPGLNMNYNSHSNIYDSYTHKQLGKYLRYYKDIKGINLMPLYNCFCNETISTIHIYDNKFKDGKNADYNVWAIPVQLNKEYTLYINSSHPIYIGSTFLNNYGRIKATNGTNKYLDELLDIDILHYNNSSYNNPIKYRMFTNNSNLVAYNNNAYILIQTLSSDFASIVVIEGEHEREYHRHITNVESHTAHIRAGKININYDDFSPPLFSSLIITPLSYYTPYAPRLIEFLTEQTITGEEDIPNNILRIEQALNSQGHRLEEKDIWRSELKYRLYNNYFKYNSRDYLTVSQLDAYKYPKQRAMRPNLEVYSIAPEFQPGNYYMACDEGNYYIPLIEKPSNWEHDYMLYYEKDEYNQLINVKSNLTAKNDIENTNIVGIKNCKPKREFETAYNITGYVDKDIENALFKYRSV